MKSEIFNLSSNDLVKGLATSLFAAVITVLYTLTSQAGFDVFQADWGSIFNQVVNVSTTTFVAYLFKNFISDNEGKLGGKI